MPILWRGGSGLPALPVRFPRAVNGIARDPRAERRRAAAAFQIARVPELQDEPLGASLEAVAALVPLERQSTDVEHAAAALVDLVHVQPPADRAPRLALPADRAAC